MATSHIYLLISITLCIICILPLMWLPVYKAEPDDAAAAEVMATSRDSVEVCLPQHAGACCRQQVLPAAPVAPRWFDEPNWYDHVTALDLQHMHEDDHALVWYPDENHWELVADEGCGTWHIENDAVEDIEFATFDDLQHLPEDDDALVWYPDENHWE